MTEQVTIWQLFSKEEEEDPWLRRLVRLRLILREPVWVQVRRRVVKRSLYFITPQGELALRILNFLTKIGILEAN